MVFNLYPHGSMLMKMGSPVCKMASEEAPETFTGSLLYAYCWFPTPYFSSIFQRSRQRESRNCFIRVCS